MPPKKDKQVGGLIDPSGMTVTLMKASPSNRLSDTSQVYESKNYMNVGGSMAKEKMSKTVNKKTRGKKTDKKNKGNK